MSDLLPYVTPILGLLTFVLGIWWRVEGKIDDDRKAAAKRAEEQEKELAAHKLHVAETYATKQGMQEQTSQIMRAIEGVGHRIDGMSERLDRAFESQPARRTTRS